MKKSRISSLEDLKKERKRLQLTKEVTLRELSHGVGLMRSETKNLVVKKWAIPAALTAVGGLILHKLSSTERSYEKRSPQEGLSKSILALIPLGMQFLQSFQENDEEVVVVAENSQVTEQETVLN